MEFFFQSLGAHLVEEAKKAREEVLLVAPFIKRDALEPIIEVVRSSCSVQVVTRWHLSEIASGASDLEIWPLFRDNPQRVLKLLPMLHAKYYRFDSSCLAGSANITQTGLGWRKESNLEFLARFSSEVASGFEIPLRDARDVTEDVYRQYQRMLEEYEEAYPDRTDSKERWVPSEEESAIVDLTETEKLSNERWWTPRLRHPETLYLVYAEEGEIVTSATKKYGQRDLRYFDLPTGLSRENFELEVRWQLFQKPVVQEIDDFVETSKRFGAVRDYLKTLPCAEVSDFDATEAWQTLMRWLLYFLDDRYRQYEANYSEVFERV